MRKLPDADIIPNYYHATEAFVDDEDETNCRRCGSRAKAGDVVHVWHRYSNQAKHLSGHIELCGKCNADITALKQLG